MKLLSIGLDGASFELINQFVSEGVLPTFQKLMKDGIYYPLISTTPPHTAPGWVSSLTGVNPGKHGIYQFWDTQAPKYVGKFMGSGDVKVPFVWDILNSYGYTTGMVNIPMTHPPKKLDGYILTWPLSKTLRYCYPPDLIREIADNQGHYVLDLYTMFKNDINYINKALEITRGRLNTIRYLIKNKPCDFLMAVFTEIDRVSHFYWKYMNYNNEDSNFINAIKSIYIETDKVLTEILTLIGENTMLLIYSDHGFQKGELDFYISTYLIQNQLLTIKKERDDYILKDTWFEKTDGDNKYSVDWDNTIAYMTAPGSYGININLKGRQKNGIIDISDYDNICNQIIEKLKLIQNPLNGKPLFKDILKSNQVYEGEYVTLAPDLILIPQHYGIMIHHEIKDTLFSTDPEQNGMHSSNGMVLLYGSMVKGLKKNLCTANISDIAPTILDLFFINSPDYMDGKSIFRAAPSALTNEDNKIVINKAIQDDENAYSEKEQLDIKQRLKNLGYF